MTEICSCGWDLIGDRLWGMIFGFLLALILNWLFPIKRSSK